MTAGDDLWERHADWWQDGFTAGADPEYEEQILPLAAHHLQGATRVLDVGTGEGQVARLAAAAGAAVVGLDPTWNQVNVAAERGGGPSYLRAGAAALPFRAGAFDCVIACLVFEHIDAVDDAIAEVARVLEPGGRFLFFLNHPLLQTPNSGWIDDQVLDPTSPSPATGRPSPSPSSRTVTSPTPTPSAQTSTAPPCTPARSSAPH